MLSYMSRTFWVALRLHQEYFLEEVGNEWDHKLLENVSKKLFQNNRSWYNASILPFLVAGGLGWKWGAQ